MTKQELLGALLKSSQRAIIIESGSIHKSQQTLIGILQDLHCAYNFDGHCGNCSDCTRIAKLEKNIHPDILYFGGALFSIENARNIILKTVSEPLELETRYVIMASDKFSPEAQNAVLKLLEEDTDYSAKSKFIFIVRTSSILVETILSRSVLVTLESNSTKEFMNLVGSRGFTKKDFVAYLCAFKETNLQKASYIKEKFNLSCDDLYDAVDKMYKITDLSQDFFNGVDNLKAYPYLFVYRAIEYLFIRQTQKNLKYLEEFYKLFYRKNYNKAKNVRDNMAVMLQMWYYLNKRPLFDKYYLNDTKRV